MEVKDTKKGTKQQPCGCPYCDESEKESNPLCKPCEVQVFRCPSCGETYKGHEAACPGCGAPLKQAQKK